MNESQKEGLKDLWVPLLLLPIVIVTLSGPRCWAVSKERMDFWKARREFLRALENGDVTDPPPLATPCPEEASSAPALEGEEVPAQAGWLPGAEPVR